MAKFKMVAKLIEWFGKVNTLKVLSYGGTLLSIIAGIMTQSHQQKSMEKTVKEEVEKAIQLYVKKDGGVL